jgi:hypothetical protein
MDMVTCAGSFLLGGVSAATLMGLLLLFIEKSPKKSKDVQHLRLVATNLLRLTECKDPVDSARSGNEALKEIPQNQPDEDQISPNPTSVDGRWGMEYTPFPGLP